MVPNIVSLIGKNFKYLKYGVIIMEKDETSSLLLHLFQVPNPKMTINNKSI